MFFLDVSKMPTHIPVYNWVNSVVAPRANLELYVFILVTRKLSYMYDASSYKDGHRWHQNILINDIVKMHDTQSTIP